MAVRVEQEPNGRSAIIIDGWDKGIADSPYNGISVLKNVNATWWPGVTYVNYKRKASTLSGGTPTQPKYYTTSSDGTTNYVLDNTGQVWVTNNAFSTFTLLTGNHTGSNKGQGILYWNNYLVVFGGNYIEICGNGTGVGGITSGNWVSINSSGYFYINQASVNITAGTTTGQTTLTLSSSWQYGTGTYQVNIGSGTQYVNGSFTNGSTAVTVSPSLNQNNAATTIDVNITPLGNSYEHMAIIGYDSALYFCNGAAVGSVTVPAGQIFNPQKVATYRLNYAIVTIPINDTATWLVNLSDSLLIGGKYALYPWGAYKNPQDTFISLPSPINENISKMINILNTIYIFAGNKGNIYMTNGYQISIFKKIPDSFINSVDPNWTIGGVMFHRNKLFFGANGVSQDGNTKLVGIFSITLIGGSSQFTYETAGALTCESQNSYGFTPTASNDATGVLIDGNSSVLAIGATQADTYGSAWYNNSIGGFDYNDTTLWDNFQPSIETDIIPVGTFLQSRTFENIEYKLDAPLMSGDAIRLSYRTDLSSSYTTIGTTTATGVAATQVLSDNFSSNINNAQWVQFKIEFKCAVTSSYIRLREVRIH